MNRTPSTLQAKTFAISVEKDPESLFAWLADPSNLPRWHAPFCRSLLVENGRFALATPRGRVTAEFRRCDHARLLDLEAHLPGGHLLRMALRVLPNGGGSEAVMTIVQPQGLSESDFHVYARWCESALRGLRKTDPFEAPVQAEAAAAPKRRAPEPRERAPEPAAEPPRAGKRLFVGNLPYSWTEEDLKAHFAETGSLEAVEIARFRGKKGRSRGFGFVEMSTEEEAQNAIAQRNGSAASGREIIVRLTRPREERRPSAAAAAEETAAAPRPKEAPPQEEEAVRDSEEAEQSAPASLLETGAVNHEGYEIFPRRAEGERPFAQTPRAAPRRRAAASSPYFHDTGDVENRGGRRPRRRRRR